MSGTLRHIAKHSAIYAVTDILAKIVGFILLPLYTRKFSTYDYGMLSLILILNTLPARFITQGISTWAIKAITLDYADDPRRRRIALSTAHYYLILSALVVSTCIFFSIPLLSRWLLRSDKYGHLMACTCVITVLETARIIPLNVLLRANFRSVLYSTLSFCEFVVSVTLSIVFIVYLNSGIAGIIYTDLIVGFAMTLVSFLIIRPELVPVFSWPEVRKMVRYGWPLLPARLSMWLLDFADRFQLQYLSTTIEVGLYAAGAKFAKVFEFLFLTQFEKVWPSVYFPLSKEEDSTGKFAQIFTYLFLAGCGLGLGVILFVGPCVKLTLEEHYWRASKVVVWLVAGFILEVTYQVFSAGIRIANQTRYMPHIVGAGAAFNVLANFWVLPRWGMVGAGFTTFCANAILVTLSYHYSKRYFPVPYEWGRLTRIAGSFTAIALVDSFWSPDRLVPSMAFKAAEFLAFPVALWLLGVLSAREIQSLRAIVKSFTEQTRSTLRLKRAPESRSKIE